MNTEQLTALLARIQVLDNRQVDQLTIEAWEPLVADLEYDDAVAAVNTHFRTSDNYLKPVHVVSGARIEHRLRRDRQVRAARRRVVELGGQWSHWSEPSYDLARAGALVENGDPTADDEVRKVITHQKRADAGVEDGHAWAQKNLPRSA